MSFIDRRNFTKTSLLAGGVLFFPGCIIKQQNPSFLFFSDDEAQCIISLCEQIIPADETFGGSTEAEVIYYIDRQLVSFFKHDSGIYRDSIKKLQKFCLENFDNKFNKLEIDNQIKIMEMMEKNNLNYSDWINPSIFFNKIRLHTMQGFYGSPIHGGNKNYISFDILKIEGLLRQRLESPSKIS